MRYTSSKRTKSDIKTAQLARLARIDGRTVVSAINKLSKVGLIKLSSSGEITVCNVRDKHPNLRWKQKPDNGQIQFDDKETETETKTKTETETESAKPRSSLKDDDYDAGAKCI